MDDENNVKDESSSGGSESNENSEISIIISPQNLVIELKKDDQPSARPLHVAPDYHQARDELDELLNVFSYSRVFKNGVKFVDKTGLRAKLARTVTGKLSVNLQAMRDKLFSRNSSIIMATGRELKSLLKKKPQDANLHALAAHAQLFEIDAKSGDAQFRHAYEVVGELGRVLYNDGLSLYHLGLFLKAYTKYLKLWIGEERRRRALPIGTLGTEGIKKLTSQIDIHKKVHLNPTFSNLLKYRGHQSFYSPISFYSGQFKSINKIKYAVLNELIIRLNALLKEMVKIPLLEKLVIQKLGELPKSKSECDTNMYGLLLFVRSRNLRILPKNRKLAEAKEKLDIDRDLVREEAEEIYDFHSFTCEQYMEELLAKPVDKTTISMFRSKYIIAPLLHMGSLLKNELNTFSKLDKTTNPDFADFKREVMKTSEWLSRYEEKCKPYVQYPKIKGVVQKLVNTNFHLKNIQAEYGWLAAAKKESSSNSSK